MSAFVISFQNQMHSFNFIYNRKNNEKITYVIGAIYC